MYDSCAFGSNVVFVETDHATTIIYGEYSTTAGWVKGMRISQDGTQSPIQDFAVDQNGNIYLACYARCGITFNGNTFPLTCGSDYYLARNGESCLIKCDSTGQLIYMTHSPYNIIH